MLVGYESEERLGFELALAVNLAVTV